MSDIIFIDGKRFFSTRDAGYATGFSRDYLARLCKGNKLSGRIVGKNLYIDESSLRQFLFEHDQKIRDISEFTDDGNVRSASEGSRPVSAAATTHVAPAALHAHIAEQRVRKSRQH